MKGDQEGNGVKRRWRRIIVIRGNAGRTNNQGVGKREEEKSLDVPRADIVVAIPGKVNNDQAKLGELQRIIEKVLSDHSDPRFCNNWKWFLPGVQKVYLDQALRACKQFMDDGAFLTGLTMFGDILDEDDKVLASFVADVFAECVHEGLIVEGYEVSNRIVAITHGLDQEFVGTFDLQELDKHVRRVMKWREVRDHKYYRSPSFAMVQSSGMGNTKLMQEYARQQNYNNSSDMECRLLLCIGGMVDVPPNHEKHYHAMLRLGAHGTSTEASEYDMKDQLAEIERTCKKDNVVFFFDEAQKLIPEIVSGPYYTILWWLWQSRGTSAYVGVLAGKLLGLSKFQIVYLDLVPREMLDNIPNLLHAVSKGSIGIYC